MTPEEIAARDGGEPPKRLTRAQLRKDHYARDDNPSKPKPKKARKKT
jgi:hypothetical protein